MEKRLRRKTDWMQRTWRPMMAICYMVICCCDFMLFPVLWSLLQYYDTNGIVDDQWKPITLQGAGLFHMAMGAILGVAAWSRGVEKARLNELTYTDHSEHEEYHRRREGRYSPRDDYRDDEDLPPIKPIIRRP